MPHMDIVYHMEFDIAGRSKISICEAEIFQCLRVSSGLFWRWSQNKKVVSVPCTRHNFMHLTSFLGNFVGQLSHLHQTPTGPSNGMNFSIIGTIGHCINLLRWVQRLRAWNPSVPYRSLGTRPHTSDPSFLSIQRFGAMAGGSEMPPSLECTF